MLEKSTSARTYCVFQLQLQLRVFSARHVCVYGEQRSCEGCEGGRRAVPDIGLYQLATYEVVLDRVAVGLRMKK